MVVLVSKSVMRDIFAVAVRFSSALEKFSLELEVRSIPCAKTTTNPEFLLQIVIVISLWNRTTLRRLKRFVNEA
jgi:hypothetical protein